MENLLDWDVIRHGYAFTENERERSKAIYNRYLEIKDDLEKKAVIEHIHEYKRNATKYLNEDELLKEYSREDLLIFADDGNLCFGGYREGNEYWYWTD
jgi:hypothetical protein